MPASDTPKKAGYFIILALSLVVILILFSPFKYWLLTYISPEFGYSYIPADGGSFQPEEGTRHFGMAETWLNLLSSILKLIRIFIGMALVITVVRFIGDLIVRTAYRNATQREISTLIKTVMSIVIYIVAFFLLFQREFPTVQLAPLFTGSTIIGIVVGLALQDTLGNLFAGLAMQADQPFQVGVFISLTNRGSGVVESVSWRGVKIRTNQNKLLIISNAVLSKEVFEVAPKNNLNARYVSFNTLYSHSPAKTIHMVREAVRQVENVSHKIRPIVRIRNLGDNGIDWEVKYWLDDYPRYNNTDALIRQRIWYLFQREGFGFAYPTRTVYMEDKPPEVPPEDIINQYAEKLSQVEIFSPLSEEEIERLANESSTRIYAPGEAIVRQGEEGKSMCVIVRGHVKVQIPEKDGIKTINDLRENDFFGEMSLLTGEPRTATVVAVDETEVLRIDTNGLKPIFEGNPALVQSIYELVEERRELLNAQEEVGSDEKQDAKRKSVMRSIRKFFGLRGGG